MIKCFITEDLLGYNIRKNKIQDKIIKTEPEETVDSDSSFITSVDSWSSSDMDYTTDEEVGENHIN